MKKVRAVDDIVFQSQDMPLISKGSVFCVGGILGGGIVLQTEDGDEYVIDAETFEAGFEIAEL